jgi:hypothetical protein
VVSCHYRVLWAMLLYKWQHCHSSHQALCCSVPPVTLGSRNFPSHYNLTGPPLHWLNSHKLSHGYTCTGSFSSTLLVRSIVSYPSAVTPGSWREAGQSQPAFHCFVCQRRSLCLKEGLGALQSLVRTMADVCYLNGFIFLLYGQICLFRAENSLSRVPTLLPPSASLFPSPFFLVGRVWAVQSPSLT